MSSISKHDPPKMVLGVDLGSVYARAAVVQNCLVEMIKDSEGNSTFPSRDSQRFIMNPEESEDAILLDQLSPEAYILKYFKSIASKQFDGAPVEHAIITVRPKASDSDRQRLKDIGSMVGLDVLRIINAHSAACIAHKLDEVVETKKAVVFDMGGSGLGVSVFEIEEGILDMIATEEDAALAGSFSFLAAAERSRQDSAESVDLVPLANSDVPSHESPDLKSHGVGTDYVLERSQAHVTRVLDKVNMQLEDVEYLITTGEPSDEVVVQQLVYNIFKKEPLRVSNGNRKDAVAIGAAIQGNDLMNSRLDFTGFMCCLAVIAPLHIGIETCGGLFCEVVRRHNIPGQRYRIFTTLGSSPSHIKIRVFDGISKLVENNHFLGELELPDVAPGSRILVTIDWNEENFSITIIAKNESSDDVQTFLVPKHMELDTKGIDQVFKERDRRGEAQNKNDQLTKLLDYVKLAKINIGDTNQTIYSEPRGERVEKLSEIEGWATMSGENVELDELDRKLGQARALVEGCTAGRLVPVDESAE